MNRLGKLGVLAVLLAANAGGLAEAKARKGPDLTVRAAEAGTALAPGRAVAASDTTRNGGRKKAKASTTAYFLSADKKRDAADARLATRKVKALAPRKASKGQVQLAVPAAAALGPAFVLVCADAQAKVRETSEKNNCRALSVTVAAGPLVPGGQPPLTPPAPTTPEPAPTATPTPTVAPTATPTATPTPTPTATPTPTPTATPPDLTPPEPPQEIAPDNPDTANTTVADSTEFLYTGQDPTQKGVDPDDIKAVQVAVLRGRVVDTAGQPLTHVQVTVLDHPELGYTATREDGGFEMAVNGGETLTLDFERQGSMSVQRTLDVPWQDFVTVDDVVMTPYDSTVTPIDDAGTGIQVAEGAAVTDEDGTREAKLLFEPGTDATMELPNGQTKPLGDLEVRATEYTTGEDGAAAMPGDLPATSAYTYAVEFSVDEAVQAGATDVKFDKPVVSYVDNFLGFPAGTIVPSAYYDEEKGAWVPSENGLVIKVISSALGIATVDIDGDGQADPPGDLGRIGMDTAELQKLATLYPEGDKSLWRVQVRHFTPWDYNWPYGCEADCDPPRQKKPPPKPCPDCKGRGSIISYLNQSLGEKVDLDGTPYSLQYSSDRMPGFKEAYTLRVPLTGASVKPSLQRVDLKVTIAGRDFTESFAPGPNLHHTLEWDGMDAYGREVVGAQNASVRIGYVYPAVYLEPDRFEASFGQFGGAPLTSDRTRNEIIAWQEWEQPVGATGTAADALGGWTLDVHHAYDPQGRTLYGGDGTLRTTEAVRSELRTVAGYDSGIYNPETPALYMDLGFARGVDAAADGGFYIADTERDVVHHVSGAGEVRRVAGGGNPADGVGDGGPATAARLLSPGDVEVADDGTLYISDTGNGLVRRVRPDGVIETVAGGGDPEKLGDGGPATAASLRNPRGLALAPDGTLYVADASNDRVRRISPDGRISTAAGGGSGGLGDGGPAVEAALDLPVDVAVDGSGTLYVADALHHRVRAVTAQGVISTVAGDGGTGATGDGGPATQASIGQPQGIDVSAEGTLYIADRVHHVIRRVSRTGTIARFAGTGQSGHEGGGGPPMQARLSFPQDVAVAPDGAVLIADAGNSRIRRAAAGLPGFTDADFSIPDAEGREIFQFDATGRHLRTVHALTGATLLEFAYDAAGRLSAVSDREGLTTTIERDGAGAPLAIVAPGGERTALTLDAAGWLHRIAAPGDRVHTLGYAGGGMLTSFQEPAGGVSTFTYDTRGRLATDTSPDGQLKTITPTALEDGQKVEVVTKLGRKTTFTVENLPSGRRRKVTDAAGDETVVEVGEDGRTTTTSPDGTTRSVTLAADPRWGMSAPRLASSTTRTPSGRTRTFTADRTVDLADGADLMSVRQVVNGFTVGADGDQRRFTSTVTAPEEGETNWTVTSKSPQGRQVVQTLDPKGRLASQKVAGFATTAYAYDERGNVRTVTAGAGETARQVGFTHTDRDQIETVQDALGRTAGFTYDDAGRAETRTAFDGVATTGFGYDANGNTTSLTPPGRGAHAMTYTPGGALESYQAPDASPVTYAYDLDGDTDLKVRADKRTIDYGHDAAGRLETVKIARGTITTAYDQASGHVASVTAPGGVRFDVQRDGGFVTGSTWSGPVAGSVGWALDAELRPATTTVNGQQPIAKTFSDDGLITGAGAMTLAYGAAHGLLTGTALGEVTTSADYDEFADVRSLAARHGETALFADDVVRDDAGRVTARTETVGGVTREFVYAYHPDGRLKGVAVGGQQTEAYTWDANGNRLTGPGPGAAWQYDAQDRLTSAGDATFTYREDGELATRTDGAGTTSYDYDELGNLLSVSRPGGEKIDYVVDGDNHRVGKKVAGTLTQGFLWEGPLRIAAELDGSGAVVSRFVYATRENVPDYMVKGGATYRIVSDRLGSVRLVVDAATGEIAQRLDYDAFGRVLEDTAPGFQPFGYAGGLYDPDTGLVRFGLRDYDAATGRWTAKDPSGFAGGDTNLYAYVQGDPVNQVDPTGLFPTMYPSEIAAWARAETIERWPDNADGTPNPARHNGEGDAFRHCLASCEMARQYGTGIASAGGTYHELTNPGPEEETIMDEYNNECGRKRAEKAKSSEDCENECESALKDGSLMKKPPPRAPTITEQIGQALNQMANGIMTPMGPVRVGWF